MQASITERLAEHGIRPQRGQSFRQGDNYTICPSCSAVRKKANQKKPCLSVKLDVNGGAVWNCHHCGYTDNIPGRRPGDHGYRPEPPKEIKPAAQPPENPRRPKAMIEFFASRGISEETMDFFGIYLGRIFFPQIEAESPAIVFPYVERGKVVNNKYRMPGEKHFRQDKDAKSTLYNVDSLVGAEECIWVEGEFDVQATHEAGYQQEIGLVSLPEGAPPKHKEEIDPEELRYEAIRNCAEVLAPIKKFYIATDNDDPGNALAYQIAMRIGIARCWRVNYPEGCKDLNEVLIRHGKEAVQRCIETARPMPLRGIQIINPGDLSIYRTSPAQAKFGIGIPDFDDFCSLRTGQLMVVSGIPTHGKSELVDFIMVQMTRRFGWKWSIFSPEHESLEQAAKLAEKYIGEPFKDYGGSLRGMNEDDLKRAEYWIGENFSFVVQDEEEKLADITFILDRTREAYIRQPLRGLVIDPYNRINHDRGNLSETDYVAKYLSWLKVFARHHDMLVIQVAHPGKMYRDREGNRPVPTLYDISGSANWYNVPDIGIVVHRPDPSNFDVDVHVHKVKRKDQGRIGTVELTWDKFTGRYKSRREGLL